MRWLKPKISKVAKLIILFFLLIIISNCDNFLSKNNGYIVIGVKFPKKSFNIKKIPDTTIRIDIEISGEGLQKSINLSLSPKLNSVTIPAVKGNKNIDVKALDEKEKVVATGKSNLFVYPDLHNKAEITLVEVKTPITPSPTISDNTPNNISTNSPSASPSDKIIQSSSSQNNNNGNNGQANNSPSATPTPSTPISTDSATSSSSSSSTFNNPNKSVDVNVNVITSTPIPSGITLG